MFELTTHPSCAAESHTSGFYTVSLRMVVSVMYHRIQHQIWNFIISLEDMLGLTENICKGEAGCQSLSNSGSRMQVHLLVQTEHIERSLPTAQ